MCFSGGESVERERERGKKRERACSCLFVCMPSILNSMLVCVCICMCACAAPIYEILCACLVAMCVYIIDPPVSSGAALCNGADVFRLMVRTDRRLNAAFRGFPTRMVYLKHDI